MLAAVPLVVLPLFMVPCTVTTMPSCKAVSEPLDVPSTAMLALPLPYSTPSTNTLPKRETVPTAMTPPLPTGLPPPLPPVLPLTTSSPRRQAVSAGVRSSAMMNQERLFIVIVPCLARPPHWHADNGQVKIGRENAPPVHQATGHPLTLTKERLKGENSR